MSKPERKLKLSLAKGERKAQAAARHVLRPELNAALTYGSGLAMDVLPNLDLTTLVSRLEEQGKAVAARDLSTGEKMLSAQAHTLDALFGELSRRALRSQTLQQIDAYLRLALKAQSQCRTTWESISEIQNPRTVAFVRADQANIANGHQQINNAHGAGRLSPNELLERADESRLDRGTPPQAIRIHPALAAVGALNGTKVGNG